MPPKPVNSGNDAFLVLCIKHSKEKFVIDYVALAAETGLSAGGAANKFRGIIKQFEDDGVPAWQKKQNERDAAAAVAEGAKKKPSAKRKAPTKKTIVKPKESSDGESDADNKDVTVKAENIAVKEEADASNDSELSEEEEIDEPPKKKGKTATKKADASKTATKKATTKANASKARSRGKKQTPSPKTSEGEEDGPPHDTNRAAYAGEGSGFEEQD